MVSEHGRNDEEHGDGGQTSALPQQHDNAAHVWAFDPEGLNATWTAVRPGDDYVPGSREAERVADLVRDEVFRNVKDRTAMDAVFAMVEQDGSTHVWVKLGTAGALELVERLRACREVSDELVDEAG